MINKKILLKNLKNLIRLTVLSAVFLWPTVYVSATTTPEVIDPKFAEGTLIKGVGPEIYLITKEGNKRWITDEQTFNNLKKDWSAILFVSEGILNQYPLGEPLTIVEKPLLKTPAEIELAVREVFADAPMMISVAQCESKFRQYTDSGNVLKGSGLYIGVFQIDEKIHANFAKSMGMDIFIAEGNLAYARYLYDKSGVTPWKGCVKTGTNPTTQTTYTLTKTSKVGDTNSEVKTLQQMLNKLGYTIAQSGAGSPGNETTYFGAMTKTALQKFQCDKKIACTGDENTTGYGLVGPKTRAILLREISGK
jgi:hypothetical protein